MAERKKKKGDAPKGAPGWMVTYGDLMSLLMTFFVLLLSFSTINEEEFKEALLSLKGALGVLPRHQSVISLRQPSQRMPRMPQDMEVVARQIMEQLQMLNRDADVEMTYDDNRGGLRIVLPSELLFGSGNADLVTEAYPVLRVVADVLTDLPDPRVEVRGHTDNMPLRNAPQFADNWDLSYARAKNVMAFLQQASGLDPRYLEPVACGESQPLESNATPEGRQANRRVELFMRGDFSELLKQAVVSRIKKETVRPTNTTP
jgi:chemotaxis protein MotB